MVNLQQLPFIFAESDGFKSRRKVRIMRRLVLHLLVALLAFFIGVSAAMLLGHAPVRRVKYRRAPNAVYVLPASEAPPAPPRFYACPSSRRPYVTPLRSMPMIPDAPLPVPAVAAGDREVRRPSRRTSSSVEVIRSRPAAERKKF